MISHDFDPRQMVVTGFIYTPWNGFGLFPIADFLYPIFVENPIV